MTLAELEKIVRAQFIWDKEPHERWRVAVTSRDGNEKSAGIITFIGCAYFCGFKDKEVSAHICIPYHKHSTYLSKFRVYWNQYSAGEVNELFKDEPKGIASRVATKTKLIMGAIKLYSTPSFISLEDIADY
jgi:hypothetical protein